VHPINAQNEIEADIWQAPNPLLLHLPPIVSLAKQWCGDAQKVNGTSSNNAVCLHAHAIVALQGNANGGNGCLLGLDKTQTALSVGGGGSNPQSGLRAPNCVAASDTCGGSSSCLTPGFALNGAGGGNVTVNLQQLIVATQSPYQCPPGTAGNNCILGSSTTTYPLWTPDPFATDVMPNPGSCPASDPQPTTSATGVIVYSPGTYCNGISIGGHPIVVFNPGTYFLGATNNTAPSNFSITGGAVNQVVVMAFSATPVTGGTKYQKGDTLTVTGNGIAAGNTIMATTIKVTSVNGKTGAITGFTVSSGAYCGPQSSECSSSLTTLGTPVTVSTTGGSGTGATFSLTFTDYTTDNPSLDAVSFLLTGPTGADVGGAQVKNAAVSLRAPSPKSGSGSSLLFWQDCYPKSSSCTPSSGGIFNGSASPPSTNTTFDGVLYFPHSDVTIAGNSTFLPTDCTSIVADIIKFQGNGSLQNGCLPFGSGGGGVLSTFKLVE
jgi:hypothetical protein